MEKRKWPALLALDLLYALAYVGPLAIFLLMLWPTNPQILRISRTMAITISTFCVLTVVFSRIYGGFHIGRQKSRPIIYQMSLSVFLTDLITYLQLQIMNVNANNNQSLEFFSVDFLLLLGAVVIQILAITAFTYLGNYFFFSINPPKKCCVVTANDGDREAICSKIRIFHKQFVIRDCVNCTSSQLHEKIRQNDTIILFHLPAKENQEIIEYCYKCQKEIYFELSDRFGAGPEIRLLSAGRRGNDRPHPQRIEPAPAVFQACAGSFLRVGGAGDLQPADAGDGHRHQAGRRRQRVL